MKQPEITIESQTKWIKQKLAIIKPGDELRMRCSVAGAPEMILRWSLLNDIGICGSAQCGNLSATIEDHVSFAFLFLVWKEVNGALSRKHLFSNPQ